MTNNRRVNLIKDLAEAKATRRSLRSFSSFFLSRLKCSLMELALRETLENFFLISEATYAVVAYSLAMRDPPSF